MDYRSRFELHNESHLGAKTKQIFGKKDIVRNEQYGSRAGKRAQSVVLNKILSFDNYRIMRQ